MITTVPNGNTSQKLDVQGEYRKLPGIDALLREPGIALLVSQYGQGQVTTSLRELLDQARQAIANGQAAPERSHWTAALAVTLAENNLPSLRPVINATGVLIHTNLGRAPLSDAACAAVSAVAGGYSNLE